ncbi:MAG: 50S ribosomal protein L15 [Chloroflexi bacterium]|nr:50S ribosomal protein L15 [Chloroflexota bacterium]MCC6896206.1 50S ribosomal protein L15 [Anaerolineae bacterium]
MKLHDLRPNEGAKKKRKRLGRGNAAGQGRYGGRGIKGQGSRGGKPKSAAFEGGTLPLVRRLPFKRGFNNIFRIEHQEVRLDRLAAVIAAGEVTPAIMAEHGLIRDAFVPVVILGNGESISKKFTVKAHRVTSGARAKIEAAGGSVEIIPLRIKGIRATFRKHKKEELAKIYGES